MEIYAGCPVIVGMPISEDYKVDVRISTVLERWDRTKLAETYYAPSFFPTLGRDKIVSYAKYRVPAPTHILFVDSDVLPKSKTIEKLMAHDKDIVTGVYPISTKGGLAWSVSREDKFTPVGIEDLPDNLFKIEACGFGCILIKMHVFNELDWPFWENELVPGGIKKGEDIYFCDKVKSAGFDIWCDPMVKCNHIRMTNLMSIVNNLKEQ